MTVMYVGTGWYNCEARIYRFDMSTDLNTVDPAIVETDESRLKRTLTAYCFTREQQEEMKKEVETAWAADGYIILSGTKPDTTTDTPSTHDTVSASEVQAKRPKGRKTKLVCAVM